MSAGPFSVLESDTATTTAAAPASHAVPAEVVATAPVTTGSSTNTTTATSSAAVGSSTVTTATQHSSGSGASVAPLPPVVNQAPIPVVLKPCKYCSTLVPIPISGGIASFHCKHCNRYFVHSLARVVCCLPATYCSSPLLSVYTLLHITVLIMMNQCVYYYSRSCNSVKMFFVRSS